MGDTNSVFKKWIPNKIILPILVLSLLPHMMLLSMFSLNSTFTASFMDIETDDVQFLFSLAYATVVCGLFLNGRFFHFFNIRSFVLLMTILNIVVLGLMATTRNYQLILILRFIQGPLILFEGCILLPVIISLIKSENARVIAFSFLYGWMLTGDKFTTSIMKFAIDNYSHHMIYYTIIGFHIVTLFIYALIFSHGRLFPKKPLYQLNLLGVVLMMLCLISGAYALIYGKKLYWFESEQIVFAFIVCVLSAGLFLWRERYAKRPLFHFEIFKSKRVLIGIILFFFFYLVRSSLGNIYQVMRQVWNWPWEYVLKIQYYNVAGSFIGVFSAYFLLKYRVKFQHIFFIGFSILAGSMYFFVHLFYPDTRAELVGAALLIEGVGQGLLFCPLVFYMLGSVHPSISSSVSQGGTAIRFWTNTIGFSIMQNSVLYLTTKHQFLLTRNLDLSNTVFQKEWANLYGKFESAHIHNDAISLSVGAIKTRLYNQALLVSNIEIFWSLFLLAITLALIILILSLIKSKIKIIN